MLIQLLSTVVMSAFSLTFPFAVTGPQGNEASEQGSVAGVCERPAFDGSRISKGLQTVSDTVVADLNRDGRLDVANQSGPFQVLSVQFGTGNGYFGEPVVIDPASSSFNVLSSDFNNDGNVDLLTPVKLYLGTGTGSFQVPRLLSLGSNAGQFVTGDFNGDDNIDLAGQVSSSRIVHVLYGDGAGNFAPPTIVDFLTGNVDSFSAADMNGDGISDLVATLTGNVVGVALGSSTGVFGMPASYPVGGVTGASRIATGDVDSDGDLDVVTSTVDFFSDTEITTLLNNGSGVLTAQPQFIDTSSNLVRLLLVDVNADNQLDLLATNTSGVLVRRFGNNDGTFGPTRRLSGIPGQVKMFFEDFTGDGIRDLGLNGTGVGSPLFAVLINDAMGNLGPVQQDIGTDLGPTAMATADFNEDGKMDVVVANEQLSFWVGFGNGAGGFVTPLSIPVTRTPRIVQAFDLNNDGNQDIVGVVQNSTEATARSWVAFGNGDGTFGPEILSEIFGSRSLVFVDFNRDGILDIAVPASQTNNRVTIHRGVGSGTFVFNGHLDVPTQPRGLASADFDGDGFKDLAVLGGTVSILINTGNFTPLLIGSFPAGQTSGNLFTSDFNGDGKPDLAATTDTIGGGIGNPGKVVILLGVGNGGFGAPTEYLVGRGPAAMTTADFDGDGNLDLAVANSGYNLGSAADTRVTVMYGNGQGAFPRMQDFAAANFPRGIGAIDIDTDGDMDILTPDWGQSRLTLLKNICLAAPPSLPAINANANLQVNEGDAGDTSVNLTVTMTAPSTVPVRVRYYTAPFAGIPGLNDGEVLRPDEEMLTTAARRDYVSAAGTLVFAPGETSRTIQFTVRGDLIDEFDEHVSVFLYDGVNASINDNQTIVTIIDNDNPPSISIGDVASAEGNTGDTTFSVPVTPSMVSEKPISMQYVTGGGTATANVDYRFAQTAFTLPAGAPSGAIPVAIIGDLTVEPDETVLVQISQPVNATIGDGTATVTIANDDVGGSVQFSAGTYSGVETVGLIPVTITRTGGTGGGVSVRFRTQAGTATPGQDYVENITTVVFGDNETSKTVQVEALRDELDELDETVNLTLDQPSGVTIGSPSSAVLTIQDVDNAPDLSIQDGQVIEGNSGTTTLKLFLVLSRPTQRVVTVNYATADVTATAGSDYVAASGTFMIQPGVTRIALDIVVNGDTTFELNETLHLNLSSAANANLIDNQAIGTIVNDEASSETTLEYVSLNQAGTGSANSDSIVPAASADGNVVAFETFASNIAGTDSNGQADVYVRNLSLGQNKLVSINATGTNAGNCAARMPVVSGNGRYVAFISCATDLVTAGAGLGDFDGFGVYLRDLQTDQTRLISLKTSGVIFSAHVWAISHDGRFVVLQSNDTGITTTPDPAGTSDLYLRDTVSNTTQLITINAAGTATANGSSGNASINRDVQITPNGRYVFFPSMATDLVTLPHAGGSNFYVRDLMNQTTTAASVNAAGTSLVGASTGNGSISDDGRYVFFTSTSNSVTPNDPNTASDVFRRDMQAGTNLLVSVNLAGTGPGNAASGPIDGSADGRYAAFVSAASDISSSPDANGFPDVYWRDITSGVTRLISANATATSGGNLFSDTPRISGNGQRVLFRSAASDLIPAIDNNANFDQYLRDVSRGRTFLVSGNLGGTASGNQPTLDGIITTDGSRVIFPSAASNLLPNDLNGLSSDIFAFAVIAPDVSNTAPFDFDGDGKTDVGIFRPSVAEWWINRSSDGNTFATQFGVTTDAIVPADYTGDGKADIAFWRPSTGQWFVLRSEDFSFYAFPFGANGDIPATADYDADGKADAAVFRPSTATWFVFRSTGGTTIEAFGAVGDIPVPADYDGDGKADLAIFRPSVGQWWLNRSTAGLIATTFGDSAVKPVQGDYTGDGKSDIAFWRPTTGEWFVLRSEDFSFFSFPFGTTGDTPAPGDYDGDGKHDGTVFRGSTATWFSQRTTAGTLIQQFGQTGDRPIPNAFVPQ